MKLCLLMSVLCLGACADLTPQQRLQAQCDDVHAEALRKQIGCKQDTDVRAQLYQQCQTSCNGGVDRETIDRCLVRCDEFLAKQKKQ